MEVLPPHSGPPFDPAGRSPDPGGSPYTGEVGSFTQGDAASRWALGRYLLGRALAVQVSRALLGVAVLIAAVAVALYLLGLPVLAVVIGLIAVAVLGARAILSAVLRRTTMPALPGSDQRRLRSLEAATRKDVSRELRRLGLPGRALTMPLLAVRLAGRRRADVLARLRDFDVERVVPPGRLDDLYLLLKAQSDRGGPVG